MIRRHAHDVRNHLNALELDTMLLEELVADETAKRSLAQMRRHCLMLETEIRMLLVKFDPPRPVTVAAGDLIQLWKLQVDRLSGPELQVVWPENTIAATLTLDVKAVVAGLTEWTLAAGRRSHGKPLTVSLDLAGPDKNGPVRIGVREPQGILPASAELLETMTFQMRKHGVRFSCAPDPVTSENLATLVAGGVE